LFNENELSEVVYQESPPSGTAASRVTGSPLHNFWDDEINAVGAFEYLGEYALTRRKTYNLMFFFELYVWRRAMRAVAQMETDGWTDARKRAALKSVLVSWGIPAAQATTVANGFINNSTKPAHGDLGLAGIPRWARDFANSGLAGDEENG